MTSRTRGRAGSRAKAAILLCAVGALLAGAAEARPRSEKKSEAQRHYRLGQLQSEQGKTLLAIESLRRAIALDPDYAEAHNYLGFIHLQQSAPREARKEFKKAVRINPYYTDAHNHLGLAYRDLGKYERALRSFETALNDRTYRSREKIFLNIGHLHLIRGDHAEAIRSFEQSVQVNPNYLRGHLGLGTAYLRSGRADLADRQLRKVVTLGPDSAEAAEARSLLARQVKQEGS